jgi:hypothetical protein
MEERNYFDFNLDIILIQIVVNIIILLPVLWLSGKILVGEANIKFVDPFWIIILVTVNQ